MADYLIYWRNYALDRDTYGYADDNPLADWRTSAEVLHRQLKPGDRMWFVVAGESCNREIATAAYLANVYRVREIVANSGDNPIIRPMSFGLLCVRNQTPAFGSIRRCSSTTWCVRLGTMKRNTLAN